MNLPDLQALKLELSLKAKNGLDFILAACVIWFLIAFVWTLPYSSYNKSILTFIVGGFMLPLAWALSKLLKTEWKIESNPLQPLGLWLNFAQLFYFPFLVFTLIKFPEYFVMTYVIITGAHFFPYAWYYDERAYAVMAGIISVGALITGLIVPVEEMFLLPVFMGILLVVLAGRLFWSFQRKKKLKDSHKIKK